MFEKLVRIKPLKVLLNLAILLTALPIEYILEISFIKFYFECCYEWTVSIFGEGEPTVNNRVIPFTFYSFVHVALFGPMIEEIIFRSWLINFNKFFIPVFIGLLYFILPSIPHLHIIISFAIVAWLLIMKDKLLFNLSKPSIFINRNLVSICIINSIVFGNLHLLSYTNSAGQFVWDGYIDFVRTFSGLVLCLIRVRMGLGYAIFYHGLSNALIFFIKYRYEIGNLIDKIF
jgi:hypothetical protein